MINVFNLLIIQTKLQMEDKKIITIMFWILKLIN
jgi:hypothetical protein